MADVKISDMENIAEEIKEMVREHGLCNEWEKNWDTSGGLEDPRLYDRLFDGMIWAGRYGENWPSKEYLTEKVGTANLEKHGIFVDGWFHDENAFPDLNKFRRVMLMGKSNGLLVFNDGKAHHLYVRNDSHIGLYIERHTMVNIMAYNRAKVDVFKKKGCVVGCVMHDKSCKVTINSVDEKTSTVPTYSEPTLGKKAIELWRKCYFRLRGLKYRVLRKFKM